MAVVAGTVVWQYGRMHEGAINSPDVSDGNAGSRAGNSNRVKKISDSKKIRTAQSYDEIYKYIKRSQDNSGIAMYARSVNETAAVKRIRLQQEDQRRLQRKRPRQIPVWQQQMAVIHRPMYDSPV